MGTGTEDETEVAMSFEEKATLVQGVIAVAGAVFYAAVISSRAGQGPIADVAYAWPMITSIGGAVVAGIIGTIIISAMNPKEAGVSDVRDVAIRRFGTAVGQAFLVIGALGALVLAMFEARHFWIAQSIYGGFVLSAVFDTTARLVAYRRGLPS